MTTDVAVLLGSKSDRDISEKTIEIFHRSGIEYTIAVASAHRTPARVIEIINTSHESGVKVFIAIAGLAARIIATMIRNREISWQPIEWNCQSSHCRIHKPYFGRQALTNT